jgi:hypothetical protein
MTLLNCRKNPSAQASGLNITGFGRNRPIGIGRERNHLEDIAGFINISSMILWEWMI